MWNYLIPVLKFIEMYERKVLYNLSLKLNFSDKQYFICHLVINHVWILWSRWCYRGFCSVDMVRIKNLLIYCLSRLAHMQLMIYWNLTENVLYFSYILCFHKVITWIILSRNEKKKVEIELSNQPTCRVSAVQVIQ